MTETLCISGTAIWYAGDNVSATITGDPAPLTLFINRNEAVISNITRHDWVANYAGASANVKLILDETCAKMTAIDILNYKPKGEDDTLSRLEYEDRINVLREAILRGLSLLKDQKRRKFIESGA